MEQELAITRPVGPPIPKWAYSIMNPLMMTILRSPLHRGLSNALMILIFSGRKSGKRYMTPVGYLQEGERLFVFSHAPWAKNFIGGAPVAVRLRGELRRGTAQIVDDPALIRRFLQRLVDERGEEMAMQMGFIEQSADGSKRLARPAKTTFVEIRLE